MDAAPPLTTTTEVAGATTVSALPNAFARTASTSADPLLAGLQLAQERLAYHLAQSRVRVDLDAPSRDAGLSGNAYHGGAVTSLLGPADAQPSPPPLRRDAIDQLEAEDDNARAAAQARLLAESAIHVDGEESVSDGEGAHAHRRKKRRHHKPHPQREHHVSRRAREHARRVDAALSSAAAFELRERTAAHVTHPHSHATQHGDKENGGPSDAAKAEAAVPPSGPSNSGEQAGASGAKDQEDGPPHRRGKTRRSSAHRQPPSAELVDPHLRSLPPAGNDALHSDAHQRQEERGTEQLLAEGDGGAVDLGDYDPDADGAADYVAERVRLLQESYGGHSGSGGLLTGYARYVRPADDFQRGPVPYWVRAYSNTLLFDRPVLDDQDASRLALGGDVRVALPVDAVVLRLRGDIARVRQLRDRLAQSGGWREEVLHADMSVCRHEVYNPAEPNWGDPSSSPSLPVEAVPEARDADAVHVEMPAAVPSSTQQPAQTAHSAPAGPSADTQADAPAVVVVGQSAPAVHSSDVVGTRPSADQHAPAQLPPPHSQRLLPRSLEEKDLQRSMLTQTIPPWRRRGAAVKFLTELLELLEDRLQAFGKQLDDPVQGAALELIGAPDSSGVDGSVHHTYPPALERAMRTTITNTLLSDIFATSYSALGSRALRISEALRRRQTPLVHRAYVTQTAHRPLYDPSKVQASSRRRLLGSVGEAEGAARWTGVDTRKSYSVHVDYVRFQPSVEGAGAALFQSPLGVAAAAAAVAGRRGSSAGGTNSWAASRRSTTQLSSSDDPFSSVLLGSYISVFFPKEKGEASTTHDNGNNARNPQQSGAAAAAAVAAGRRSLGTDNVDSTTAALLLAVSAAARQSPLVAFTAEEYLVSLLLQYYEQYRLLQLNLLPALRNRFFYQEQLTQLQGQTVRTPELSRLQARLERLAETSASVERGCLHVMILLWNAVLEERRRQRRARRSGAVDAAEEGEEGEEGDDPPILVQPRSPQRSHRDRAHKHRDASGSRTPQQQEQSALAGQPPSNTPEERRSHPPLFADDGDRPRNHAAAAAANSNNKTAPAPVVHAVENAVTYNEGERAGSSQTPPSAAASSSSSSSAPFAMPTSLPIPLLFTPDSPDPRHTTAHASPLLAPPASVSTGTHTTSTGGTSNGGNGHADLLGQVPATKFRFFLRRYGTVDEVPYRMGDDLLWYAAEVEGTDVLPPGVTAAAAAAASAVSEPQRDRAASALSVSSLRRRSSAGGVLSSLLFGASEADELLYFQLVVFTRSHAAMVPQYVGCTTPRPLTTAKVIFFNETFEVRALHEPAELLLHLIPVTAGPAKTTVMSTVRLRPTLTRQYTLLPLQPPTAFMFRGRLFSRNHNSTAAGKAATARALSAATPLHGVLAVSTTWTSSQGLTVPQIEKLFLRGGSGGGIGADPLDPQLAPLLRTLRGYYLELDAQRSAATTTAAPAGGRGGGRGGSAGTSGGAGGRRDRRGAAIRDSGSSRPLPLTRTGTTVAAAVAAAARAEDRRGSGRFLSEPPPPQQQQQRALGRHASTIALLRQRHATASLQRQLTTLGPSALFTSTAAANAAANGLAARGSFRYGGPGGVGSADTVGPLAGAAAAGAHDRAIDEVLQRLPTVRQQQQFRRWLIRVGRMKPADEVESRLLELPIPLDDEDAYLQRKSVLRLVEKEEEARNADYSTSGAQFDSERYYKAPSAISGLALSNLPRETKLKLWQERQRRLLLTLKADRDVTDAEKLETIVKVPKLVMKLVFDFAPRSQLNPHRKVRPKTEDIDRALLKRRQDSRIVIHIMKAHNLPFRADGTPLEPFMQASFVAEAAYTRSEVGSNPSWFQTLELPFQPLDFEEDTLSMIDDDVVISLYDKVEVRMAPSAATTAAVAHETHYRTERRFIGTLRIPFYSLHQASQARMEGVYPLRIPRWVLGYNMASSTEEEAEEAVSSPQLEQGGPLAAAGVVRENPLGTVDVDAAHNTTTTNAVTRATAATVATSSGTHAQLTIEPTVQLYVSLWPPLQRDPPKRLPKAELQRSVHSLFVSPHLHYLHRVALKWQTTAEKHAKSIAAMNAQAGSRQVDPFVKCSTGDMMLVCRYMLPHGGPPPPSVRTVYEAIRYVSLLPFVADMMAFGEKDVWSTNAELLAMRSGDYEELALLLVHFLRYLAPGRPTYAVVGSGSIYQQTILVLHQFADRELYLIDPRSGWVVPVGTPYGTLLRDVYMVISHDQMWANTQLSGLPHRMTWDLGNPTHWLPCFDSARDQRIQACLPHLCPIQREVLDFPPPDAVKSREIEVELRACLKRALLTWRNGCPQAYHRGVETILRELLEAAEEERCSCGSARRSDITRSAAARLSEYFGESVTGEPASALSRHDDGDAAGATRTGHDTHRRKAKKKTKKRGSGNEPNERDGDGIEDEEMEELRLSSPSPSVAAGASPPAAAATSGIRMLGSPVMGSYNPSDPHFEELLQQVYESAVHEVGTNEVSFAAGTYVKSYTGDVCAMWVFLVAICRG